MNALSLLSERGERKLSSLQCFVISNCGRRPFGFGFIPMPSDFKSIGQCTSVHRCQRWGSSLIGQQDDHRSHNTLQLFVSVVARTRGSSDSCCLRDDYDDVCLNVICDNDAEI